MAGAQSEIHYNKYDYIISLTLLTEHINTFKAIAFPFTLCYAIILKTSDPIFNTGKYHL